MNWLYHDNDIRKYYKYNKYKKYSKYKCSSVASYYYYAVINSCYALFTKTKMFIFIHDNYWRAVVCAYYFIVRVYISTCIATITNNTIYTIHTTGSYIIYSCAMGWYYVLLQYRYLFTGN